MPNVRPAIAFVLLAALAFVGATGAMATQVSGATPSARASAAATPIDLGAEAWSTRFAFGGAWIQVDPPVDELVKIDAATGRKAFGIAGGTAVAFTGDAAWVTLGAGGLLKVDPATGETLGRVDAPGYYLAAGAGSLWIPFETTLTRVDPGTLSVVATIEIDAQELTDVAADGTGVWVMAKLDDTVVRIDPRTNTVVAEVETGAWAHGIVIDGGSVWVTNYRGNSVSRIDAATNRVVATIEGFGSGVGIVGGDGAIWATGKGEGVFRINPATEEATLVAAFPGEWNYGIAYGGGELWVSSVYERAVYRVPVPA